MVTRQQVAHLGRRIEALADRHATWPIHGRCPTIIVHLGETEEAAWERHLRSHPEDRDPPRAIIIRIVDHETATKGTGS
jgi:hypothetical protein